MAGYRRHPPLVPPPDYVSETYELEISSVRSGKSAGSTAPSYASDRPPSYRRSVTGHVGHAAASSLPASPSTIVEHPTVASSTADTPEPQQRGLPDLQYAPGFRPLRDGDVPRNPLLPTLGLLHSSHGSRQYRNVAVRRQRQFSFTSAGSSMLNSLPQTLTAKPEGNNTLEAEPAATLSYLQEDPELVGEMAARNARAECPYHEDAMSGVDALQHESASWDFMLGQMSEWDERERNWNHSRTILAVHKGGFGGRLLGKKIEFGNFRT